MTGILHSLLARPLINLRESFVDNVFWDKINEPEIGSILYCDMYFGYADHSGIYVGDGLIVSLKGTGDIEIESANEFIESKSAMSIYVSCNGKRSVGKKEIAERAMKKIDETRDYNFILDNCHQFCSRCLTDDFENSDNFRWMLKHRAELVLGANTWRVWDTDLFSF